MKHLIIMCLFSHSTHCLPCLTCASESRDWELNAITWIESLDVSDRISLVSAAASLLLSLVIAVVQYRQTEKMKQMEQSVEDREERHHQEEVDAKTVSFIVRYGNNRSRLPLCAIAAMHNDTFLYSHEVYRAFCGLPREVQNQVLERSGANLRIDEVDDLAQEAIDYLIQFYNDTFPKDSTPFYDNAKYVTRSISHYGHVECDTVISVSDSEVAHRPSTKLYNACIVDTLNAVLEERSMPERHAIDELMKLYSFASYSQVNACQFATTLAYWLIIYSKDPSENRETPGIGEVMTSEDLTLEDLFLLFLLAYYVRRSD